MAQYIRNLPKEQQETRGRQTMTIHKEKERVRITVSNLYEIQSIRRFSTVTYTPENYMWKALEEMAGKLTQNLEEVKGKKLVLVTVQRLETMYLFK